MTTSPAPDPATPLSYGSGIWPISGSFSACFLCYFAAPSLGFIHFGCQWQRRKLVVGSCLARLGSPVRQLAGWLLLLLVG